MKKTGYAGVYLLIDDKEYIFIENHRFTGRNVIYSSETEINENTIPKIINGAMNRHEQSCREIEYLERHFTEDQLFLRLCIFYSATGNIRSAEKSME